MTRAVRRKRQSGARTTTVLAFVGVIGSMTISAELVFAQPGQEFAASDVYDSHQRRGSRSIENDAVGREQRHLLAPSNADVPEQFRIQPNTRPFFTRPMEWDTGGEGLSLTVTGEPKSGTTWTARLTTELALHLCGTSSNDWCALGGLRATGKSNPAPWYEFELLDTRDSTVYLHFDGNRKHQVFGIAMKYGCDHGVTFHPEGFGDFPCRALRGQHLTRQKLMSCLPDQSTRCLSHLPFLDPNRRRMIVVFRDPRNVVISEHKMRIEKYHHRLPELNRFIQDRIEAIVAWISLRWAWHEGALGPISHLVFYEDLKEGPAPLVNMATFIGLNCTHNEAVEVWQAHYKSFGPESQYTRHGLPISTLEFMNATMERLLPAPLLARYGMSPS